MTRVLSSTTKCGIYQPRLLLCHLFLSSLAVHSLFCPSGLTDARAWAMSAIIIQQAAAPGERARLISSSSYHKHRPSTSSGSSFSSVSNPSDYGAIPSNVAPGRPASAAPAGIFRSRPLKETISPLRFVLTLVGIWSANFVFAFQASAIPTLAPTIGSGFNRAELGTYLGSVFTLASTAGQSSARLTL